MLFTLRITDTDSFFALEEALDQFVMNTEDIEDDLREDDSEKSREMLRRLDAARKLLDTVTGVLCALAEPPTTGKAH
jgi:hypothetical protein